MLAIASFIIPYLVWQVGNNWAICPSEYPFTGLLPEMFSVAFLDPSPFRSTEPHFYGQEHLLNLLQPFHCIESVALNRAVAFAMARGPAQSGDLFALRVESVTKAFRPIDNQRSCVRRMAGEADAIGKPTGELS